MKGKVTVTGANFLFFSFMVLFFIFQMILVLASKLFGEQYIQKNTFMIILITQYLLIFAPILFYSYYKKLDFKKVFRLNKIKATETILITIISIFAYGVAFSLNIIFIFFIQSFCNIPPQPIPTPTSLTELIIGIVVISITPAFCEELLHRGIMLSAYERRGTYKAIVISAMFFAVFHFDLSNLLGTFFLGILIAFYVIRTNSIFSGMIAHFINNTIAQLILFWMPVDGLRPERISISIAQLSSTIIFGLICTYIMFLFLRVFKKATNESFYEQPPVSSIKGDVISILTHWPVAAVLAVYITVVIISLL